MMKQISLSLIDNFIILISGFVGVLAGLIHALIDGDYGGKSTSITFFVVGFDFFFVAVFSGVGLYVINWYNQRIITED
jgi:hypothetical protein